MSSPLDGVKVLDLGQIYQGGYAGLLLSYLGADVVKVEPPWGDNVRARTEDGQSPQFQLLNVNKRSVTLNLTTEAGTTALRDLVEKADVLIENFARGKMNDLGVGYEELRDVNPRLIYAHGSGYGDYGPYADYPAMDLTVQAMSGVMETTGFPDGPPVKAGPAVADFLAALHLVVGITGCLFRRERTGEGEYVDVAMQDSVYPTLASPLAAWVQESDAPPRTGNRHSGLSIAPYNAYETNDGYITIICVAERHWESLAQEMDKEELLDKEKYATKVSRANHLEDIDRIVQRWVDGQSSEEVVDQLLDAGVPCASVKSVEDLIEDEHLRQREMIRDVANESPGRDEVPVPGMPIKFESVDEPDVRRAPFLGEHTDEVLSELAGYDAERIAAANPRTDLS